MAYLHLSYKEQIIMNKKFISLVATIKALVKSEAALDKAQLCFYEQQDALKGSFVQALCDLQADYSTEAAAALVGVIEPLGANRVNGLLASRLLELVHIWDCQEN